MRNIRKNKYLALFITFLVGNLCQDYYNSQEFHMLASTAKALWFLVIYAFFEWAWDSKDYKKAKK